MGEKKRKVVLPGDKLASIEEFVPGAGTATVGDSIISTVTGGKQADMTNRVMIVESIKTATESIPRVGDYIAGFVDSASPTMAQVTIEAINEVPSNKQFAGMLSLREERRRKSPPIKAADIVRAKVISTKNSIFHLAIGDQRCGVIYTVCSNCGGRIVPLGMDRVKCPECGLVDDRLLAEDLLKPNRSQANL
ncbi:MAG: exosome complex RNA-binding protein Csl4 [Nitrososphaerota archaeon]|nr:exosome complex RNA-binding protein Csl4 [Nitrososphaerota archaeon]